MTLRIDRLQRVRRHTLACGRFRRSDQEPRDYLVAKWPSSPWLRLLDWLVRPEAAN